jgi:DNA-binding CsgD family transcriptional regulator
MSLAIFWASRRTRSRSTLKNLYTKFQVRIRAEAYALMGYNESGLELTKREKEVRELLHQGQNAEQIARELCITTSTVRQHIWNTAKESVSSPR